MPTRRLLLVLSLLALLPSARLAAAPNTPARVEIGLTQTAAANPPLGANEFGDPGGTAFSAGNLISDSGFEPISLRRRVRVVRCGTENGYPWFEFTEGGGITNWELTTTGLYNGANVRLYRLVDAQGQPLPTNSAGDNLELTNAAAYLPVGTASIPVAGAPNLPLGGWVDTAYAMPNSVFGTRANLDYTDARWVENGKTYYYIVTAIGSNNSETGGTNESDPSLAPEFVATPQAGLATTPRVYAASGDGLNEIGSVQAGGWFNFQPALAGATGTVTWALLNADNTPYAIPAGLGFNTATGEFSGSPTVAPPTTRLRFRATASNGTATRDFILNNPAWPTTGGTTRPLPPTNVTATAANGYVHLSWSPSPTAGVVGYRVYRAELPRAQQRQRVYLNAGAPTLQPYDYVHIEKRILTADPMWAHPRVRSGHVEETWRGNGDTELQRVPHPGTIPAEFRFPGETCLRVTATTAGQTDIGGPYIFYPLNSGGESEWYSQLEPGRTYRYEAWMRQEGLAASGQVSLTFGGQYSSLAHSFAVDGQWRLYGFEFTAPTPPTDGMHGCPVVRFTGPGRLWFDNIRLFRADTPADITATLAPPSPAALEQMMASQPLTGAKGMLRSMNVLLNQSTMAAALRLHRDASLTMNWYQSAGGASNMTAPVFLNYALLTGDSAANRMTPWLNVSSHMSEQEWLMLVEYLSAPIDPSSPAEVAAKPWAYLRYQQRGVATPWTDEFTRIYLEFANETWHNGAVSDEWFGWSTSGSVHAGSKEFGLAANFITTFTRDHSPYFAAANAAGKLRFVMGSNYVDYAEQAATGAPLGHAIGHTTYVGPKWEVGETPLATYDDHGIQATLLGSVADTEQIFKNYRRWREQLAAAGHVMDLLGYEGGPSGYSLPGQDASDQAHEFSERYGKSLAMGVAALDAWLAAYRYGFTDQAYLGFGSGDYWSSHTAPNHGNRPHPGWLALVLRNRYASGRLIDAVVTQAPTVAWDGTEYPLVSSYAFRDGHRLGVFLLSRKLAGTHDGADFGDGSTPVTLVLPGNPTGPATLYHLSGDPRATNRAALDVTIQQTTATLGRETTVSLPQGSIYLYVVDTDLPDRDDPLPPPATSPAITYTPAGAALSWPAIPGATGYTIFRSAKPYFDRADVTETYTSATNAFTDPGAVGGTTYYYRVAATNAWGTGFWTLVASGGHNPSAPVLPAPDLQGLLETTGALVANWSEVAGATGYRVGIATKSGGPYVWTDAGIATGWTFSGLENNTTYFVTVHASSPAGRGPDATERHGTPLAAGQTAVLAAWEAAELNYSAHLANPPTLLPVARHLLAVGASAVTRSPAMILNTNNYGFPPGQSSQGDGGHYDGKFPFQPQDNGANFGATGGGSFANALARDLYIGCTVTPAVGQSVSISGLDAGFQYSFGNRDPMNYLQLVLRYRIGADSWHDVPAPPNCITPGFWLYNDLSLALAGEAALQNVQEPVELRFYFYCTGTNAGYHPASLIRTSGEDLIIRGTYETVAPPGRVGGLRSSAGRHQVSLAWTPVAGASSYTLRWGTVPGVYTGVLTGLTQSIATVDSLPGGTPHHFVVEAVNSFGSAAASLPVTAVPLTSFQSWQATRFTAEQRTAGLADATADPDADGQSNLVEYAFGSAPLSSDAPRWSTGLGGTPSRLTATVPVWSDNDDLTITVEASNDLAAWTPLARSVSGGALLPLPGSGVSVIGTSGSPGTFVVQDAPAGAAVPRRFFRVSVGTP